MRSRKELDEVLREYYGQEQKHGCMMPLLYAVLVLVLVFVFAGCRTVEYVEVPVTHTEYVYRDRVDTAHVRDSIYIKEVEKGDTVTRIEYRYRERFREVWRVDTLVVRDTVTVVREVMVGEPKAKIGGFRSFLMWLGAVMFCCSIIYIVLRFIR